MLFDHRQVENLVIRRSCRFHVQVEEASAIPVIVQRDIVQSARNQFGVRDLEVVLLQEFAANNDHVAAQVGVVLIVRARDVPVVIVDVDLGFDPIIV